MAQDVPITQRKMTYTGRVPTITPADGGVKLTEQFASDTAQMGQKLDLQLAQKSFDEGQHSIATNIMRIQGEYENNPEAMSKALENFKGSFMGQVGDDEVRSRLEMQYDRSSMVALEKAKDGKRQIMDDQSRFTILKSMDDLNTEVKALSMYSFSDNPDLAAAAHSSIQEAQNRAMGYINSRKANGEPLFTADQRLTMYKNIKDTSLEGSAKSYFDALSSPAKKLEGLEQFKAGGVKINLPDGEGGAHEIDVYGAMSDESRTLVEATVKRDAAQQHAQIEDAAQQRQVDLDLQIEKTQSPDELMNLQKQIELLRPSLSPSAYKSSMMNIVKKISKQGEDFIEVAKGSQFASGQLYLNPQDPKSVGSFNKYYDHAVIPRLATMDQDGRNTYLSNLIANTGQIPKSLAGNIESASKSLDVNKLGAAADLVDRVRNINPNLLREFNESDLARLEYVRSLREAGYNDEEAVQRADEALDPKNKSLLEARKESLKGTLGLGKPDYQEMAVDNFQRGFFYRNTIGYVTGEDETVENDQAMPTGRQLVQLQDDYRKAYDSHFILTGNADMAQKHADTVVKGTYGASKVNGNLQVMKYAPENFYAIPNVDNGWMREQMLEAAKERAAQSMKNPSFNLDEDVLLIPDPLHTPRGAKQGRPGYKMMYVSKEDGALKDLLAPDELFYFSPEKKNAQMINAARAKETKEKAAKEMLDVIPSGAGVR